MQIYSVSQLSTHIKSVLSEDSVLRDVWVTGEVSSLSTPSSGHKYFTFKDNESEIRSVMFRGNTINGGDHLVEGHQVNIQGYVSYYEIRGQIQLYASTVMPVGAGQLSAEFEKLRNQLESEGLFADSRKRDLPSFPRKIGVVTSATGAVIHDITTTLEARYPLAEVVLFPASVQGDDAPMDITNGIKALNQIDKVDVIIVGRGGGAIEDLWAFNTELVARAIYSSKTPIVSAVGHESDYTIADFVADVRAATPTAAAIACSPDKYILEHEVMLLAQRSRDSMQNSFAEAESTLNILIEKMKNSLPDINVQRQRVDDMLERLQKTLYLLIQIQKEKASTFVATLNSLNPNAVLQRGYAIVTTSDAKPIKSKYDVLQDTIIKTRLHDGEFESKVL
ncbi:MAG: exodeoxyribonuclease VII large subunit [SAR202 cluster bacterium]|nr:exodeoxyribonuclease VII large subunit [SAR202 cluster bacterium]|tara:strand:+ start:8837 stop:10015 length:1179 start_codon:yes stop_codon:yes gene_type:complete